jgi:hypothetical protein
MITNIQDVGFLPGGKSLKYGSSRFVVMKNRSDGMTVAEAWCQATGRSIRDLHMANNAFFISGSDGTYEVDFIKCRNSESVIGWLLAQWGDPGKDLVWEELGRSRYNPHILIRGEENLMLFRMVWE